MEAVGRVIDVALVLAVSIAEPAVVLCVLITRLGARTRALGSERAGTYEGGTAEGPGGTGSSKKRSARQPAPACTASNTFQPPVVVVVSISTHVDAKTHLCRDR
jgi:hypothetical protein